MFQQCTTIDGSEFCTYAFDLSSINPVYAVLTFKDGVLMDNDGLVYVPTAIVCDLATWLSTQASCA